MKFKFSKNLEYQLDAINAIVDIFDTGKNIIKTEPLFNLKRAGQIISNEIEVDSRRILANVHAIQKRNDIDLSETIGDGSIGIGTIGTVSIGGSSQILKSEMDFSIEMETGTGKTYVYLRTIFELNRKYGLKKFIILVPSVAIREGVLKTLEQTHEHFKEIYNVSFGNFAYDSNKLSKVRDFSQSNDIQIMIMTVQSFAGNERLVMRQTPDRFHGDRPIDLIAQVRPVVIMDEPQNMESELSKEAILDLKPLFKIRYSATHKEIHNLVYRLTPIEAYRKNLVKKIQVYGVKYIDPSEMIFKVRSIELKSRKPVAEVLIEKKKSDGGYMYSQMILKAGDNLYQKTGNHEKYENIIVSDVNKQHDFVELSTGMQYKIEEIEEKEEIFRAQIQETIKAHFIKQQELGDKIKVLSLFFIDQVKNYVNNGIIAKIFEEEFEKHKKNYSHFKDKSANSVHKGYFASKKEKGQIIFKDTKGDSSIDKEAYDLIMKNKEQLLSFVEPVSFIFSHSALKEGWDNPNIFQICTLRQTKSEMKKRQEIGRGLRLPLTIDGDRIFDPQTNVLTVIANESYEEYVSSLQEEFESAGYKGNVPAPSNVRARIKVKTTKYLEDPEFKILWDKIKQKTIFNIDLDCEKIISESVKEINNLDMQRLAITVDRVQIFFDKSNKIKTGYIGNAVVPVSKNDLKIGNVVDRISKDTGLTRKTIFSILENIDNLNLVFENPEEFIRSVSFIISHVLGDLLINESIKYIPKNESWEISLFKEFDSYLNRLIESKKSPFDYVEYDSVGEKEFAEALERNPQVKVYTKLPRGFFIDTPIGEYWPDWAIVWHTNEGDKLYLIRETKFGFDGIDKEEIFKNLRPDEQRKILCGEKHFKSIDVNFSLAVKKDLSDLI